MSRFGEILRRERERQGLSFHDVSHVTKIQPKILEAIENEDWAHLPSRAFVRGFLKNYARALGISEAEIMTAFEGEPTQKSREIPVISPVPAAVVLDAATNQFLSLENGLRFAVVIILMGSVFAIFSYIRNYQHERKIDFAQIAALKSKSANSQIEDSKAVESTPHTVSDHDPNNLYLAQPASLASTPLSQQAEPAKLSSESEVVPLDRSPAVNPMTFSPSSLDSEQIMDSGRVAEPPLQPARPSLEPVRIMIRALNATRIEFEPSSLGIPPRDFKEGEVYIITSTSNLNLKLKEPQAVEVSVNGRIIRPDEAQPNQISVNPSSIP